MSVPTYLQGTLRKVLQLSTCLAIVNTLVSLTSFDVMGLGMGCVNCHIGSAILMNPTHPPFLFIPICLNAMTDLCINKCTSGKWPQVISNLGLSQKQFKNLFLDFFRDYKFCNFRHFLPSVALWFLYSSFRLNLVFLYNNKEVFLRNVFTTKCSFK